MLHTFQSFPTAMIWYVLTPLHGHVGRIDAALTLTILPLHTLILHHHLLPHTLHTLTGV